MSKRIRLASVVLLVAFWLGRLPITPAAAGGPTPVIPGEIVVKLHQASDLAAVAAAFGLNPAPLAQFGSRPIYRLKILDSVAPDQKATDLLADLRVVSAEPNYEGQPFDTQQDYVWSDGGDFTTYQQTQWAPGALHLSLAQQTSRGAGVTVAVLDTGIDATHPALAGHLVAGYDFVDMDSDPSEVGTAHVDHGYGHGTHVAGLIALAAPDAKIMPIRVLDRNGIGNIWVLIDGIQYAVAHGATVINLSLSTTVEAKFLSEVVKTLICTETTTTGPDDLPCVQPGGLGVVVVAAAGNAGSTTHEYPAGAGINGLLSVGATKQDNTLAAFSNRGSWVNIAAPGDQIVSAIPGGGYGNWSGTSMATPLVAGSAALLRAACPTLTAAKVAQDLTRNSVAMSGQVQHRLDPSLALAAGCGDVLPSPSPSVTPSPSPSPSVAPSPSPLPSGTPSPSPTTGFTDVPANSPFKAAIDTIAAQGIIRGYGDGRFGPDDHTLRAQMAAMIARAMTWDAENPGTNFPDRCNATGCIDDGLWRNIGALAAHDVARGYADGTYQPFNDVLFIQSVSFITRAMVNSGRWTPVTTDTPAIYPNVPLSSGHRLDLLTYVQHAGALPSRPTDQPWADWADPASRGWFAQVLYQALSAP